MATPTPSSGERADRPNPADHIRLAQWFMARFAAKATARFGPDETFQAALRGLCEAAARYEPYDADGNRRQFSPYAVQWMRAELCRLARDDERFRRVGRGPDKAAVTLFSEIGGDFVRGEHTALLSEPFPSEEEDREWLEARLAGLKPRYKQTVVARLGLDGNPPRLFKEIAADLGVSTTRAMAIYATAMHQLRAAAATRDGPY